MALGIVEAIRHGGVPVTEVAEGLFTMDNYLAVRRHRLGADLIEMIQWGMELEDVVKLVPGPESLEESLRSIAGIAHTVLAVPRFRLKKLRPARGGPRNTVPLREAGWFEAVPRKGVRRTGPRRRVPVGR